MRSELAARHALPAANPARDLAEVGGLPSYGANIVDAWRQCGFYRGLHTCTCRSLRRDRPLKIQRKNSGSGNKCLRAIGTTTRSLRNWVRSAKNLIWIAGLIDLS